jgi:hypothetical protein
VNARSVGCPFCNAKRGEPCVGTKRNAHADRITRWYRERAKRERRTKRSLVEKARRKPAGDALASADFVRGLEEARRGYAQAWADGTGAPIHECEFTGDRIREELALMRAVCEAAAKYRAYLANAEGRVPYGGDRLRQAIWSKLDALRAWREKRR